MTEEELQTRRPYMEEKRPSPHLSHSMGLQQILKTGPPILRSMRRGQALDAGAMAAPERARGPVARHVHGPQRDVAADL